MGLGEWFGFRSGVASPDEIPNIFPLAFSKPDFINIDVVHIYSKILTDVIERTHGLTDDQQALLWDNCLKSESSHGLITRLATAMANMKNLFLVYEKAVGVIREATQNEVRQITEDYKKTGSSKVGIFISFEHYKKSELVKLFSALEYCTVASLHKTMSLSAAIQIKMKDMRASTGLTDSAEVKAQAKAIATGLGEGRDVVLDGGDEVETAVPDLEAIEKSIDFLNQKRSFYLGLPECYITGIITGGLNATGESDTNAIERGLKNYFLSIAKPVLEALFKIKTSYKSQNFKQIEEAMDVLKTFSLTDDELISHENKLLIINRLLDLPEDAEGDAPAKVEPGAVPAPGAPDPKKPVPPTKT